MSRREFRIPSAHTPCEGKSASSGQGTRLRGRPGRTGFILVGHITPLPFHPFFGCPRPATTFPPAAPQAGARRTRGKVDTMLSAAGEHVEGAKKTRCERRDLRPTRRRSSRSSCSDVGSKSKSRPTRQVTSSRSNTNEHARWRRRLSSELADCTTRRQSQVRSAEGEESRSHLGQWKAGSARGIFPSCVCSGRVFFSAASDSPDAPHVGQDAS